jgi:hypothetical protein
MDNETVARIAGTTPAKVADYRLVCDDTADADNFLLVRRGDILHLVADVRGLGGRKMLKGICTALHKWFADTTVLYAPIPLGNARSMRVARAFGFYPYTATESHVWMMQTKDRFLRLDRRFA